MVPVKASPQEYEEGHLALLALVRRVLPNAVGLADTALQLLDLHLQIITYTYGRVVYSDRGPGPGPGYSIAEPGLFGRG